MSRPSPIRPVPASSLRNQVMLASAGSGKTHRLALRIIRLLLEDQPPESIVALTFTRAAACEFAGRILQMMAAGAASEAGALELSQQLEIRPARDAATYARLLQKTLLNLNRLTLGTLDSFFARMVNNFPTEVGLSTPAPRTMDELEGESAREETLRDLFGARETEAARMLATQLRQIANGRIIATPFKMLEREVGKLHDLYTLAPAASSWGDAERIWGKELPVLLRQPDKAALDKARATWLDWALNGHIPAGGKLNDKEIQKFREKTAASAEVLASTSDIPPSGEEITAALGRMGGVLDAKPGKASETFHQAAIPVPAEACAALRVLAANLFSRVLKAKLAETASLRRLLATFEARYEAKVRTRGQLTFSDYVTLLLRMDELAKLDIEYRLDGKVRHWLFDEFQDTSTRQYKVLANLINEVVTDKSGERTLFFVGDLKQSLYGWRAGNPRLLEGRRRELMRLDPENKDDTDRKLLKTRRCSQPVVDLVNATLGAASAHGTGYSPGAADRWKAYFEHHETDLDRKKHPELGDARWVRLEKVKGEDADTTVVRQAMWIADDLRKDKLFDAATGLLRPGVTCAVLVSSNEDAALIAETLRKQGIQAADEDVTQVAEDNPLTAGLVALARLTAHPGDALAEGLAGMAPAARRVVERLGGLDKARCHLAEVFQDHGAEALARELTKGIVIKGEDNAAKFLRKRLDQLHVLAAAYDESGRRDLDEFCTYLAETGLRDRADSRAVEVLTVHRSKGLQYTCVYLPCLNDNKHKMAQPRRQMPMVHSDKDFNPEWILARPSTVLIEADTRLADELARECDDAAYEALCKLYVGITRAVRRVVLISLPTAGIDKEPAERAGKFDLAELIENCLRGSTPAPQAVIEDAETKTKKKPATPSGTLWSRGDASWVEACHPLAEAQKLETEVAQAPTGLVPVVRPPRFKPSAAGKQDKGRAWIPSQTQHGGRAFGSLVHSLFERLQWDIAAFETDIEKTRRGTNDPHLGEACKVILSCLSARAVRAALGERPEGALLWTERQASLMHEGRLMPAVFDRVHVVPGKEAVILDYKTNNGMTDDALREEYREQMNSYRIAVAKLAGVPIEKVRALLIHVRKGTVVEV